MRAHCSRADAEPLPDGARRQQTAEQAAIVSVQKLLQTRHTMQVFAQDTIADLWSFVVIVWLVFVLWCLAIPIDAVLPSFTVEPLTLRLSVLLFIRGLAWVSGQLVFRRKLHALSRETEARRLSGAPTPITLVQQLDLYLASLRMSVFETAAIRACYEEDAPELFAHFPTPDQADRPESCASLAELLLLQIAERQWLLHPALLRKYFLYFHACMYYLLFIILQTAPGALALRYAWFRPSATAS
jgi:hypothetical protein